MHPPATDHPAVALGSLSVLLLLASAWDILERRVPNWLSAVIGLSGAIAAAVQGGPWCLGSAVLASVGMLGLLWWPWVSGRLGGGDLKVAMGAATWVGLANLGWYILLSAALGGGVALVAYAFASREARRNINRNLGTMATGGGIPTVSLEPARGRPSVPYAVAFCAGALATLWIGLGNRS